MSKRKKIPKMLKDYIRSRQNGKCACCLERGVSFHHIIAFGINSDNELHHRNIIMLCQKHHILFHQGDPETYQSVYEYAWYIQNGKLPSDTDLMTISRQVHDFFS